MNNVWMTCKTAGLALAISMLLNGCAGYRLGSMLPEDISSVHIPTAINQTTEPLLEVDVTRAIIEKFQQDGSLKVVSEAEADSILTVVLKDYELKPVSFRKDIRTAAEQYRALITSSVVLRRTSDNSVVAENPSVSGDADFDVIGDLTSSKLQANPDAAEDLARNIVEIVVEVW